MSERAKVRDCRFEVDYTLEELQAVHQMIEDLDQISKPDLFAAAKDGQRLLKNMERRLLYSYKIPLSEEARKAFASVKEPISSVDDFLNNTLPEVAHSLLYSMLENYCSCKASRTS